jgi:hypothetical protein
MGDRPTKIELLEAVRRFLDADLIPELDGVKRFHARVAANVLGIVARELEREPDALPAMYRELAKLLGSSEPAPAALSDLDGAIDALEEALVGRIRAGDADSGTFRSDTLSALRFCVGERLAVSNPKYG